MYLKIKRTIAWPLCVFLLIQLAFMIKGEVLCFCDNGQVELGTCFSACCGESGNLWDIGRSADQHNKHDNCSNCVDVKLDVFLRSRLIINVKPTHMIDNSFVKAVNFNNGTLLIDDSAHNVTSSLRQDHGLPSVPIIAIVLLC